MDSTGAKVAVVTGAGHGIGFAIARALVGAGFFVVGADRSGSADLDSLLTSGPAHEQRGIAVQVDLSSAQGAIQLASSAGPTVNVLVNNVGAASPRLAGVVEVTDEEWTRSWMLNLMPAVRVTRATLPALLAAATQTTPSRIINVASVNAYLPDPLVVDYSAAKAALVSYSKALSKALGSRGVRVNTVSPGPVQTELWLGKDGMAATISAATGMTRQEVADGAVASTATQQFSSPRDVAAIVTFLATTAPSNITGTDFRIDGGMITTT